MAAELVGHARFLECREQRRTANRGAALPGAIGPEAPGQGGAVIDCERVDPGPLPSSDNRRGQALALARAGVVTPTPGPVPRWRIRRPLDR